MIKNKIDKYVIIDLRNMDFMKDEDGNINYYDTEEEALDVCGMYEFENAWVMKLVYNYIDDPEEVEEKEIKKYTLSDVQKAVNNWGFGNVNKEAIEKFLFLNGSE